MLTRGFRSLEEDLHLVRTRPTSPVELPSHCRKERGHEVEVEADPGWGASRRTHGNDDVEG